MADDEPDVIIVDEQGLAWSLHEPTRQLSLPLRAPAAPLYVRWPITTGFLNGAPVGAIAAGLARGERWTVGPAPMAGSGAIWLLALSVPYRDQIAVWRPRLSLRAQALMRSLDSEAVAWAERAWTKSSDDEEAWTPCTDLSPFIDGELTDERAEAFRVHLASCAACDQGLLDGMQLMVRLEQG